LTCGRCGLTDTPNAVIHALAGYVTLCMPCHQEWQIIEERTRRREFERFVREWKEGRSD
jgi:hypothetical protein